MLGHKIQKLRKQAGLSQGELAKQLNISPSAIGMYEQGRREPSIEILLSIAKLFGVTVDALLDVGSPQPYLEMENIQFPTQIPFTHPLSRDEWLVLFVSSILGR